MLRDLDSISLPTPTLPPPPLRSVASFLCVAIYLSAALLPEGPRPDADGGRPPSAARRRRRQKIFFTLCTEKTFPQLQIYLLKIAPNHSARLFAKGQNRTRPTDGLTEEGELPTKIQSWADCERVKVVRLPRFWLASFSSGVYTNKYHPKICCTPNTEGVRQPDVPVFVT